MTGNASSPLAQLADEVIVCTPDVERSWCHTASYTCAVAAIAALNGDEIGWLPEAVEEALQLEVEAPAQDKIIVAGRGPRLADRAGGRAQAARGRLDRR